MVFWSIDNAGSWADWAAAISTVSALIGVIWLARSDRREREKREKALAFVTIIKADSSLSLWQMFYYSLQSRSDPDYQRDAKELLEKNKEKDKEQYEDFLFLIESTLLSFEEIAAVSSYNAKLSTDLSLQVSELKKFIRSTARISIKGRVDPSAVDAIKIKLDELNELGELLSIGRQELSEFFIKN